MRRYGSRLTRTGNMGEPAGWAASHPTSVRALLLVASDLVNGAVQLPTRPTGLVARCRYEEIRTPNPRNGRGPGF
jgi:hypothetical protein